MINLSKVLPFWGNLTQGQREVMTVIAETGGVWFLLGKQKLLAAAARGNIEGVCRELDDVTLAEKYRIG